MNVVDLRVDGEPQDETDYMTCQMCGNEEIRYVHVMGTRIWVSILKSAAYFADRERPDWRIQLVKNFLLRVFSV
ncbi:MAG: hypothetical protein ACYCTF_02850 [Acidiferrobacter sp.]